jgi:twitching motility protein PilJ
MPQPDASVRSFTLIALAAVMVLASAGCAAFANGETALVIVAGALALAALIPLALLFALLRSSRNDAALHLHAAEQQRQENERNQEAILRLLDEISGLSQGDLTATATVTEDITGAIADSVNMAVEALRKLVTTINGSALQLDAATRQTQALSQHLAKASSAQSRQIASATESIGTMAGSIEEVSGNAERAADVARHSVDIAHKGGDAVRRTIDGMNAIRETIQETSKRIKRLGESSQEIGNIVELINDIAEQTNILALNASIQASMAGEAGRGFAVVADEVQRLAERSANATKQIEALVRTIQTDTNGAVVSMERSTTDVVGGALLAENAGAALEEIEQVSNQIASLVHNISASARSQALASQSVARNMQVLREISSQTADSTTNTSQAIAKMAELSTGLRKSVAGFRLPEGLEASGQYRTLNTDPSATGSFRRVLGGGGG